MNQRCLGIRQFCATAAAIGATRTDGFAVSAEIGRVSAGTLLAECRSEAGIARRCKGVRRQAGKRPPTERGINVSRDRRQARRRRGSQERLSQALAVRIPAERDDGRRLCRPRHHFDLQRRLRHRAGLSTVDHGGLVRYRTDARDLRRLRPVHRPHHVHAARRPARQGQVRRLVGMLDRLVDWQSARQRTARRDLHRRRWRADAAFEEPVHLCRRRGQDERARFVALRARDPLQLARLLGDLDGGAHGERRRQMHRDLLVPVRLHRQRLRALGREHDAVADRAAGAASRHRDLGRIRLEHAMGLARQHRRRRWVHGSGLLGGFTAATRGGRHTGDRFRRGRLASDSRKQAPRPCGACFACTGRRQSDAGGHITVAPMSLIDSPPTQARSFDRIDTWVFDLDNTLYPASCRLYVEVEQRMARYIMDALKLDLDGAHALRRRYFQEHGTTLRGLMNEYGIEPRHFLDYVHEIDVSAVQPAPALDRALAALPGRKLIFTNGTRRHAERVLDRLDLAAHFDAIHDIVAIDYRPKPNAAGYRALIEGYAIAPARAAMVEDMARNLPPAAALGMTTVWLRGGPHAEVDEAQAASIHHTIDDLAGFLAALTPATE